MDLSSSLSSSSSSYSSSSSTPSSAICSEMVKDDDVLNMSPRPSQHQNAASPADIVKEIASLEIKILHLEQYLLCLYRTAFQQHLPNFLVNNGSCVQQTNGIHPLVTSNQPSQKKKLEMSKDYNESSPTSALVGPKDLVQVAPKSSSEREKKKDYSRHRSLGDHLGNSRIDDALICPDRLSEDIMRCISSIYCKLANTAQTRKGNSVSSNSSFCSSSTFSPRNLSGSWSDEGTELCDFEALKQDNGPYSAMVEVLKIWLDDESYSYAANMLQKFRSLVKSLAIADLKKTRREQKLAFWINIHNALVMHSYLAYGTQNYIKNISVVKATYNVGGHCVNAYDIQRYILGIKPHYPAPWLQTLLSPGKKLKAETIKHTYAIEYPEPLVHFALCSGAYSDPAVRIYSSKSVFQDLKVAKQEFIQATVSVHKQTKVYLPKILQYYAKDMSLGMAALLEAVSECLSGTQQEAVREFVKGRPEKCVYWSEQNSSFRYLIHKELAEMKSGLD